MNQATKTSWGDVFTVRYLHEGGDSVTKRVKVDLEVDQIVNVGSLSVDKTIGARGLDQHMPSSLLETDSSISNISSITKVEKSSASNSLSFAKTEKSGYDQLPKEQHETKIRDDKAKSHDDKDMEAAIVNGNGTEAGYIITTTIGGHNGLPKQG